MPTVTTETTYFDGTEFRLKYNVDRKGDWSLKLPTSMSDRLGISPHAHAETLDKLKDTWKRLLKEYTAAVTSTERIIAWKTEIKATIHAEEEVLINKAELSFASGLALSLSVAVFDKHTTKTGRYIIDSFDDVSSSIPNSADFRIEDWDWKNGEVKWMLWTEEREEFFAQLVTALENIILKLDGLTGDQKKLLSLIESGVPLLPTGKE